MAVKFDVEPLAKLRNIYGFAFSPDGRLLVGLPRSSPAQLFDARTWKRKRDFAKSGDVKLAAFSADGKIVALATTYICLGTYRVATGAPVCTWRVSKEFTEASGLIMSPSTPEVTHACWDNTVRVYDTKNGNLTRELLATEKDAMTVAIAMSPAGNELSAAWNTRSVGRQKQESAVTVWKWPDGKELRRVNLFGSPKRAGDAHRIQDFCYTSSGREFAAISQAGAVGLFDAKTGKLKRELRPAVPESYGHLAMSPDGKYLALSDYGTLLLWKLTSGKLVREMKIGESSSHDVGFSPDGSLLVAVSNQAYVWRLSDLVP